MSDIEKFNEIVRKVTDEPLLGFRQGELADALVHRLAHGPPMSEGDIMITSFLFKKREDCL
jgi:hypothetical protein